MDRAEIQSLLKEGILAVKNGELHLARDRLMQVVQADASNEPGWLWLSAAFDDPADQLWALQNVLAINPDNLEALGRSESLRARLASEPGAPPQPKARVPPTPDAPMIRAAAYWPAEMTRRDDVQSPQPQPAAIPGSPPLHNDFSAQDEDPYQCAYCGRPTEPDDIRCPHCGRGLIVAGPWQARSYSYAGLILIGVQLQAAMLQALLVYLQDNYPRALHIIPMASLLPTNLPVPAIVRAAAWGVVLYMLLSDAEARYTAAAVAALADIAWAAAGYRLGNLSPLLAGLNGSMATVIGLVALAAVVSQAQARVRQKVVPDRKLDGAHMFHRRALVYVRQGKWALAAVHWRQAITRAPREPLYYKGLGRAEVRLRRYDQALRSFRSGSEAAPDDPEFTQLIDWARSLAGKQ